MKGNLWTVAEVSSMYQISQSHVCTKARLSRFTKTLHGGKYVYLLSEKQVNKMFNLPTVSDTVIYVKEVWEILPSKMNYLTIKQLQTKK